MQSPELLGPLLQVERNILGASPSMQHRILSVATRCATEPYGRAAASRHGSPQPSSDAEASTDRAPRPAVWASTALSSGRVVVRGADVTGGKRGAAGRAGASRGRQPLPTTPPTRTSLALWAPRTAVDAARPAPHIGARRRGPTFMNSLVTPLSKKARKKMRAAVTSPREAAGEGSGGHWRRREAREALKSGPGASRYPSGGAGWAQELIQDFLR